MNESNDNKTAVITINEIESKTFPNGGTQFKITADGVKYKLNQTKKAGGETIAYKQYIDLGLKIGSKVEVWYKEEEKEFTDDKGKVKKYTDRTIASFKEAQGVDYYAEEEIPTIKIDSTPTKGDVFWDKKAYKQCLWNFWLEKNSPIVMSQEQMDLVWSVFKQINEDAEVRYEETRD
jgi:hypothetical protein